MSMVSIGGITKVYIAIIDNKLKDAWRSRYFPEKSRRPDLVAVHNEHHLHTFKDNVNELKHTRIKKTRTST